MATAGSANVMIDIGANLTDPVFTGSYRGKQRHQDDLDNVLVRSKAVGVEKIIITGGSLTESKAALALARRSLSSSTSPQPALYSTVGVHPTRCSEFEQNEDGLDTESYFAQLVQMCEDGMCDGKVVAIGECGLDYDRLEFCDKATQLKYFDKQFELAERTKLPMFLHNRNTDGDFYAKNRSRFSNGVVHSFTGPTEEALKLVELGLYIGINGCSLKTPENLETVRAIPTERLMIETDAPWCDIRATHAGFSHVKTSWQTKKAEKYEDGYLVKGRNEPCTIIQVLEIVSAVRGEDQEELAKKIYENTCRVFFPTITAENK
uniref:TatD related DNase n=2 Tax=Globisporangium ultimum TaxID=2052682 RepID=K3WLA3_GLOUD|nr:TatD related DNase [Globisporangium ultimum]